MKYLKLFENFDEDFDEDFILSLMKDKGWGDLSYERIEDFKMSDYYKDPIDEQDFAEQFDDYLWYEDSMDDEYLRIKSGEGRDDYDDYENDYEEDSSINLSIELENKLRSLADDSELTVDDFLEEFGVDPDDMTGFGWAAILKGAEEYKDMSDEEFSKVYDEYKNYVNESYTFEDFTHADMEYVKELLDEGLSDEQIAIELDFSLDKVKQIIYSIKKSGYSLDESKDSGVTKSLKKKSNASGIPDLWAKVKAAKARKKKKK